MNKRQLRTISISGLGLCFGFIFAISLAQLSPNRSMETSERSVTRVLMATSSIGTQACTTAANEAVKGDLFPLVPASFRDKTEGKCSQSLWNIDVFAFFIYRTLAILNYLAGAIAIILTFYAGALYLIGGGGSEAQTKQAKGMLTATYIGLVIVVLARIIVYTSFFAFDSNALEGSKLAPQPTGQSSASEPTK